MADDDRYRWLDEKAAEHLLRGSSVNARSALPGGRSGEGQQNASTPSWARGDAAAPDQYAPAARLASVLDALVAEQTATPYALGAGRSGHLAGQPAELPGEAAAVEAFRAAHAETLHNGSVDVSAGPTDGGTVVGRWAVRQGGRRHRASRRLSFGGRPLRAGFVMAVAGCALGGAAVAAGTGVLPSPFGESGSPTSSVSPLASPSVDEASAQGGSGGQDGTGGPRRGSHDGEAGPSGSPSGEDVGGKDRGRDGNGKGWPYGDGKNLSGSEKQKIAEAWCDPYEDNELSLQDRLLLEQAAGGPADVDEFCDKYDGDNDGHSGGWGNSGGAGNGDPRGGGDSGGWGHDNGGGGNDGGYSGGGDGGADGGDGGDGYNGGGGYPGGGDSGGTENGGGEGDVGGGDRQLDGSTSGSGDDGPSAPGDGDSAGATPSASPNRTSV